MHFENGGGGKQPSKYLSNKNENLHMLKLIAFPPPPHNYPNLETTLNNQVRWMEEEINCGTFTQ